VEVLQVRIVANQKVLLGPPGTGKTTSLIGKVEEALKAGVLPEQIAFVSFTKKAVTEAMERACKKFNLQPRHFPLFQTVHALAFRSLGCTKTNLLSKQNYLELGAWLRYDMSGQYDTGDGMLVPGAAPGDRFLFMDNIARVRCKTLRETWEQDGDDMSWDELERFGRGYAKYKERTGLMDFTDLLSTYAKEGKPSNARIVFIDEAQDLSLMQWQVLQMCYSGAELVVIAGDDDQSIYKWSGADLHTFLHLDGEKEVLGHSYRLPVEVYDKAQFIIKQVEERYEKEFTPTDRKGRVDYISSLDQLNLKEGEQTLILVRNVYLLPQVYEYVKRLGYTYTGRHGVASVKPGHVQAIRAWERMRRGGDVTYMEAQEIYENLRIGSVLARGGKAKLDQTEEIEVGYTWETLRDHYGLLKKPVWHEALEGIPQEQREYYVSVLRSGRKISAEPTISVNTIHGVKGGEAPHVVIISDMSKRTFMEMQKDMDSEHRVAFVGVTRAKERLTIVLPRSKYSYPY
jgi:superfamily I DNA/RNA helicase